MARRRSQRDAERLALGAGAILTARRAAELLPVGGTDQERLNLLRDEGLVHLVRGAEVVAWSEVVAWVTNNGGNGDSNPLYVRTLPKAYPL